MTGGRAWGRLPGLLAALGLAACGGTPAAEASADTGCRIRVIVSFAANSAERPADAFVREVAADAYMQLEYLRAAGGGLHLFELTDETSGADCAAALARLRADPRVRSADVDARRMPQG